MARDVDFSDDVWPVCAGKSFDLWRPDTGNYYDSTKATSVRAFLRDRLGRQGSDTLPCDTARIAFRDVTNPTNTRTMVTALVPPERILVHKAPYLRRDHGTCRDEAYILGILSSMVFDWQVRRTVELNMTFTHLSQAAVPDPGMGHPIRDRVATIAANLAACDERFSEWASDTGTAVRKVPDDERDLLLAELDACVALLYGLDENDVAVIFDTFGRPGQWDERRDAVSAEMACIAAAYLRADEADPV